ncbi:piwi-like protein 2 isoform X2 [Dysidea avara]
MGRAALFMQASHQVRPPQPAQQQSSPPTTRTDAPPVAEVQKLTIEEPKYDVTKTMGTSGTPVPLRTNYIALQTKTEGVYQYAVTFEPNVDSKNMRFKMVTEHKNIIGDSRAFDGSILYLPIKITDKRVTCTSVRPTDGASINIHITLVKVLKHHECIHLFNVILKRIMKILEMNQIGRNYYDPHHPVPVPQHKLEIWPGYVNTIQHYDGGLMLMLDVSHRVLRTDTVLDFFYELYSKNRNKFQEEATRQLVGTIVLTRYNNRTYRVDDIAWDKNPQSSFVSSNGTSVSFVDYYRQAYQLNVEDSEQPLLIHRPKKKTGGDQRQAQEQDQVICLIPELCCMTGLTDVARADFRVMKDIASHTRLSPMEREACFKKFVENVNSTPKAREELSNWGLKLDMNVMEATGRCLNQEKIFFRDTSVMSGGRADWGRDSVTNVLISTISLQSWLLVFTKRDQSKALDFLHSLKRITNSMGIRVSDPNVVELPDDRIDTYLRAIRAEINPQLQIVVAIFPTSRDDRYAAFKKLCCIEKPIPSQAINAKTISNQQRLKSVTQKIALQMNCKLGGELWAVEIPMKNLMVIGIDVYHDASRGKKSIAGFVASISPHLTRWYSRVVLQSRGEELVRGLKLCLQAALKKFHEVNGSLPEKIIVFRDGVGDGDMKLVSEFEVPQFFEGFSMFGPDYKPKFSVVVVQKRVNARIMGIQNRKLENPSPGTILDNAITKRGWYDFYLVSQHVTQGTVSPTHYMVVHDGTTLKPDHMQRLTYKLTHLYYNWPGTVRVPAPCQYAHKLAFLVGQSLHTDPSIQLSDRLYYL